MGFAAFAGHRYLNLETFKKSGDGVKTPVWLAARGTALLNKKYFPWKQIMGFFASFSRRERIVFLIRPG